MITFGVSRKVRMRRFAGDRILHEQQGNSYAFENLVRLLVCLRKVP